MQIQSNNDLLSFLLSQSNSGVKNWFGYQQQRVMGIHFAYELAKLHADKMSPEEVVDYAMKLNDTIYEKIIKAKNV